MTRRTWRQDPVTLRLVEIAPSKPRPRMQIIAPFEPFVSPVTREVINTRAELREHNHVNKVTNSADYTETWAKQTRAREMWKEGYRTTAERQELRNDVNDAIDQASSSGYVSPKNEHYIKELDQDGD